MATRMETEGGVTDAPRIELNQASADEFTTLPGIGPVLAKRIVSYRDEHGPFLDVGGIRSVPGIGASLHDEIAHRLTATEPTLAGRGGQATPSDGPGNGTAPKPDIAELARDRWDSLTGPEPDPDPGRYTPPPIEPPEAASPDEEPAPTEGDATAPPVDDAVAQGVQEPGTDAEPEEVAVEAAEGPAEPMPAVPRVATQPESRREVPEKRRRYGWIWTAMLGAALGAILGMVLALLIFAGINGSIDVGRSQAMGQVRGQMNELAVELDAVQGDLSTLQGDVAGLRERVQVLSGLTARMEQAEDALETFTVEIQALQAETDALTTSLGTLTDDVAVMGDTLEAVEAQTERATTFFEGLQNLMQEIFGEPSAPEGAAPSLLEEAGV